MQDISTEIVAKAARGDLEAFEVIYRGTAGFVYNVAYRVLYNRQDAEEITQEVFLKVYHKIKDFRFQSSFKTWVYRIAVNCAINYAKRNARERDKRNEYYENTDPWQFISKPAVGTAESKEAVETFLKMLNPDQRACIVLRNIEGLSYQQIADTLNININTVRTRIKRAREKLLAMRKGVTENEVQKDPGTAAYRLS